MPNDIPTVYGYVRVSSAQQRDSGLSIETQKLRIFEHYRHKFESSGYRWGGYFADSESAGKVALDDRKAGSRMISVLQKDDHIVCSKTDRMFRNICDFANQMQTFTRIGVKVHFLDLGIDTDGPFGEFLLTMVVAFARLEWQIICTRNRERSARMLARGDKVCRYAGAGKKWAWDNKAQKWVKARDDQRCLILALVSAMLDENRWRHHEIARMLNKWGFRTRTNGEWTEKRICDLRHEADEAQIPPASQELLESYLAKLHS